MLFILDTGIVTELRKSRPHAGVVGWLREQGPSDICMAAITAGEMQAGIERTRRHDSAKAGELETWLDGLCTAITVLDADDAIFRLWAKLAHGLPADLSNDALIAATAIRHDLTVVTRNVKDFSPFGVLVANPFGRPRS